MQTKEEIFFNYCSINDDKIPLFSWKKFPSEYFKPKHSHARGQFIFSENEFLKVVTEDAFWYIPHSQTIWIPPYVEHETLSTDKFPCIFTQIDISQCHRFSSKPQILTTSLIVNELVKRSLEFGLSYKLGSHEYRLVQVLLDELSALPIADYHLKMPKDERLINVSKYLLEHPAMKHGIETLQKIAGMSKRNLERLFEKDTGITIGEWIRHQKMLLAMEKLSSGESVSCVALDLGYKSISSFIETFKATTGKTPGVFMSQNNIHTAAL